MSADPTLLDWLQDCLHKAQDNVPFTQEHFPDHVAEASAEVRFFLAAVEFVRSGTPAPSERTSPGSIVINSLLEAVDYSINRAAEDLTSDGVPASRLQELTAQRDAWRGLRGFIEEY